MDLLTYAEKVIKELDTNTIIDSESKKLMQVIMFNVIDSELDIMLGSIERGEN